MMAYIVIAFLLGMVLGIAFFIPLAISLILASTRLDVEDSVEPRWTKDYFAVHARSQER
jgi:hypothetical protein